eukprot:2052030-Rhodomonas_salina.1
MPGSAPRSSRSACACGLRVRVGGQGGGVRVQGARLPRPRRTARALPPPTPLLSRSLIASARSGAGGVCGEWGVSGSGAGAEQRGAEREGEHGVVCGAEAAQRVQDLQPPH